MKIAFHTLGCKVNQFDTAVMEEQVREADHEIVASDGLADVHVINSCSVTENSDREAKRLIGRLKRKDPRARIVVTGCYAQTHPEDLRRNPQIDVILGNSHKGKLSDYLCTINDSEGPVLAVGSEFSCDPLVQPLIRGLRGHTRSFIKVQDGCDFDCSFCLIPRARGPGRSLPVERVIEQVSRLVEEDCQEVVLTGINLGTYGRDFSPKESLGSLLQMVIERTPIRRVRLSSLEPKTVTSHLRDVIASSSRICRHFHVPLQSGDDQILLAMNRHYSAGFYQDLILELKGQFPDAGFGTDVMVGFPGETDEQFSRTFTLLNRLPMAYFHVFPYSHRPDTLSPQLNGPVDEKEITIRADRLRRLSAVKLSMFLEAQLGRQTEVLFEKERDVRTGLLKGLSDNYARVFLRGSDCLKNTIVPVRFKKTDGKNLEGEILQNS